MHDQPKAGTNAADDLRDERAILAHVVDTYPATLRLSDLIRELGDPDDFTERDRTERAIRELVKTGLLFRCEGAVLPTRTALHAYRLLGQ
jgi:hypothetical protein